MAAHVSAYVDFQVRRLLLSVMRKEADDLLNPIQRHCQPLGQRPEALPRQVAVARLNLVELLNDHEIMVPPDAPRVAAKPPAPTLGAPRVDLVKIRSANRKASAADSRWSRPKNNRLPSS